MGIFTKAADPNEPKTIRELWHIVVQIRKDMDSLMDLKLDINDIRRFREELPAKLDERIEEVNKKIDETLTRPEVKAKLTPPDHKADEETIELVNSILGFGWKVEKNKHDENSYMLILTPPDHLKENEADRRTKVLRYLDGLVTVKEFAEKVREYSTNWAKKRGINYAL